MSERAVITQALADLRENHNDLPPLAKHIENSYQAVLRGQPAQRAKVFAEAKNYCVQALASVAYQVNQVACAMNNEIDSQMEDLTRLEGSLNIQKLAVSQHEETLGRRKIANLAVPRKIVRYNKVTKIKQDPQVHRPPQRYAINFNALDSVGAGGANPTGAVEERKLTITAAEPATRLNSFKQRPNKAQVGGGGAPTNPQMAKPAAPRAPPSAPRAPRAPAAAPAPEPAAPSAPPPPKPMGAPPAHPGSAPPPPPGKPMGALPAQPVGGPPPPPPGAKPSAAPPPPPSMAKPMAVPPPPPAGGKPSMQNTLPVPASRDARDRLDSRAVNIGSTPVPVARGRAPMAMPPGPPMAPPPVAPAAPPPAPPSAPEPEDEDDLPEPPPDDDDVQLLCRATALYDYNATQADELTFNEGEVIGIVAKNDDGWFEGVIGDRHGLFPGNYVDEIGTEA